MRPTLFLFLILILLSIACQSAAVTGAPSTLTPDPVSESTATPQASAPESTFTPTSPAAGVIHVDTLEQEVYPFLENGKCSLGEAIFAANSGQPKDSCAAGVINQSVIELMFGDYHFTQRDHTPPQVEWMASVVTVGDALPPIIYSMTIHGNDSRLIRDDAAEPFRFFELMFGTLTLKDLTLQGGDVQDDWGGAIYSMNSSITLKDVHFVNNRAENGGGIYFTLGALNISNSEFTDNHATRGGAAIFIDSSKSTIQSTQFVGNSSDGNGGALYAETVTLDLKEDLFIKNGVTGDGLGSRGGGLYLSHVNLDISRSQFYQNEAPMYGGAIAINNPELAGIDPEEGDPIEPIQASPYTSDMFTSIPGFQSTLEAHPSGIFVDFHEDAQIHDSCFANNITINPEDPNWTSGLLGRATEADGNYWGHPSGPSGMGPGSGDSVGKTLIFTPFLTQIPEYCIPTLGQQQ
jgi:predicted outer membrane repeat protein